MSVYIRPLRASDALPMASLLNNKKIWDNLRDYIPYPYHVDDASFFIHLTSTETPTKTFAIVADDAFCGVIGLVSQQDVHRKTAEIGYWLGEPFWGQGIASQAVALVTQYGFEQLELLRIYAGVFAYNHASKRVLEKNGYQLEGIARKALIKNNQVWDEYRYAIVQT